MVAASMEFFGYPVAEWSILIGIIGALGGVLIKFFGAKARAFVDKVIDDFVKETVTPLVHSIDELSSSFKQETKWVHEKHTDVVQRLAEHDKTLKKHDQRLDDHAIQLAKQENQRGGK